ncbi:MAG TPA: hypothetical protein VF487_01350 [Chitinophagaceae bacterium]
MEKKPIKRSPQLAPLSREHHEALLFVWKIRQGLKFEVSCDKLREFTLWFWKGHIKQHFFQEEKILLPYLPVDHPMAEKMRTEHAQVRELVLSLDKEAEKETFIQLTDLAEKHIRWEERKLFIHLEEVLTTPQLDTIYKALEAHPVVCGEWDDVFWVKK